MFARFFTACLHGRPPPSRKSYLPSEGLSDLESGGSAQHSKPNSRPPSTDRTRNSQNYFSHARAKRFVGQTGTAQPKPIHDPPRADVDSPKASCKHVAATKVVDRSKGTKPSEATKQFKYYSRPQPDAEVELPEVTLNHMFNSLRSEDEIPKKTVNGKMELAEETDDDTIQVESVQRYAEALGVDMFKWEFFVLCEVVKAELGQISRKGFVEGWKSQTHPGGEAVKPSMEEHKKYIRNRIKQTPNDAELYKKVYRHAFIATKDPRFKAIETSDAIECWSVLFSPSLHPWKTANVDLFQRWTEYLTEKWKRGVNKDMWNQTLEFANKSMQDDTLGFWSEDQAWPGVIDDFVLWCRENNVVTSGKNGVNSMEVD